MHYIIRSQPDRLILHGSGFVVLMHIFVVELTLIVPIHFHAVRHQRIEPYDFSPPVPQDLAEKIAEQEQMRHHRFSEDERSHFRIRLIMKQEIQRMIPRLLFTSVAGISVQMQWKRCNCF